MNDEVTVLRQQIDQLNYVINLLINENRQLKAILYRDGQAADTNNLISSKAEEGFKANNLISSKMQEGFEPNNLISSNTQEVFESNNFISSKAEKEVSLNKLISSNAQEGFESNNLVSSKTAKEFEANNLVLCNGEKELQANDIISSVSLNETVSQQVVQPACLQTSILNEPVLQNAANQHAPYQPNIIVALKTMRVERSGASRQSVKNSLKLLQHLAQHPQNNTKQLAKATGMSESGLSKRLSALRRQGYVTKLKVRHYVLTQKALDVLSA